MNHTIATFVLILLFSFLSPDALLAQPGGDDLETLRNQLKQIQGKLDAAQHDDDGVFSQRAPEIGRQRAIPRQPVDDDLMTIRFYDLSELFTVAPQYPARLPDDLSKLDPLVFSADNVALHAGGGFGGGGGGVFNVPPTYQVQPKNMSLAAARVSVDTLIQAIQRTVEPDRWGKKDDQASVSVLGNTLLISATDAMHGQIGNLLELFRKHWGKLKTVSIDAFWVRATADSVQQLLDSKEENRMVGKIDQKKWQSFFEEANTDKRVAYAASINGHNGQTLNAVSGRQKLLVVDAQPLHSTSGFREHPEDEDEMTWERVEKSVVGLQPIRRPLQLGAALQVSPLATRGGNFVILDLHTRVNELIAGVGEEVAPKIVARSTDGESMELSLDTAEYVSYRLSTTIRCPKNEVILAGGMTYDSTIDEEQPNLYLFIRSSIHEIEPDRNEE